MLSLGRQMEDAVRESAKKVEALKGWNPKRQLLSQHLNCHSTLVRHTTRFSLGKSKERSGPSRQPLHEQALCFIESFGLSVEKVVLKSKDDSVVELNYSSPSFPTRQDTSVNETLYLLEKFGVSDECYHELTMIHPNLPRSYKVKNIRSSVSSAECRHSQIAGIAEVLWGV